MCVTESGKAAVPSANFLQEGYDDLVIRLTVP